MLQAFPNARRQFTLELWLCSRRLSPSFTGDRHVQKTHVTRSRDSVAGAGMDLRPPLDRGLLAMRHMATGLAGWNGPSLSGFRAAMGILVQGSIRAELSAARI
ncbi:uncharacterized protein N7518_007613 [Penicillium psychrosexuale]|uniref:uncharacterized protein n=1 Tax=Penicillium psychrosexuale TaxID=1002107 RepID=UPI002544DE5B|nr:uncharacterized protein N7518_007613 [Penicillium psychrosexuale]KAJ5790602.1 hypothetical protein N7518_007613 [Penicillium psychrosexuale]